MEINKLLEEKRGAVMALAARHGAHDVRVFGSVARGEPTPESDIDLLVKMEEGRSLLDLSALVLDLRGLLGIRVDVVSEDGLYWLLRRKILKEASLMKETLVFTLRRSWKVLTVSVNTRLMEKRRFSSTRGLKMPLSAILK